MPNLSKSIWELHLSIMKNILKLMEFKFGGRDSTEFKYVKEQVMNDFYDSLKRFFANNVEFFERCDCGATLRHGWNQCPKCSGSGYKDRDKE